MESYAFHKNEFIPLSQAKVSVMTHALHYGTAVFEGIRGNWNEKENTTFVFRPREHYERFLRGCRIMKIALPYSADDLSDITSELVERNQFNQDMYIRPLAFKGAERVANLRLQDLEDDFVLFAVPFGAYMDIDTAARCCTSSWRRMEDTMIPPSVKISGLYVNGILAKTEATLAGFDEAIMLTQDGYVSEGTGENIFLVIEGKLVTPPDSSNILQGITRESVSHLAQNELGIEITERPIRRSELYLADEAFFTGTAAHLTPIGEIDNRIVGKGGVGAITQQLLDIYFDVIRGNNPKYLHWCSAIKAKQQVDSPTV